jgi:hypothetical protein
MICTHCGGILRRLLVIVDDELMVVWKCECDPTDEDHKSDKVEEVTSWNAFR